MGPHSKVVFPRWTRKPNVFASILAIVILWLGLDAIPGQTSNVASENIIRPTILYVLLGTPAFQYWALTGIQQARKLNPDTNIVLVHTTELTENADWLQQLRVLRVELVLYDDIVDIFSMTFADKYRMIVSQLEISLNPPFGSTGNSDFMQLTMIRLAAVHRAMQVLDLKHVIHMENDQMLYATVQTLATAAESCDLHLGMTRLGRNTLAPAVLYIRQAADLFELLSYMDGVFTEGGEYAMQLIGSPWVSDMTLTAIFFNQHELQASTSGNHHPPIATLPNGPDQSCMFMTSGYMFDAAPLGQWCCGTFFKPTEYFTAKSRDASVPYWDGTFEWRNQTGTNWRVPFWNGHSVFNLHMHSKALHLWTS